MMRVLCACLMFVIGFVGFDTTAKAACQNLVGGVCVDKKVKKAVKKPVKKKVRKKAVKKKSVTRKPAPKKVVEPVVVAPVVVAANSCIQIKEGKGRRGGGNDAGHGMLVRNVTIKNHCAQNTKVYISLSPCRPPRAFFYPFKSKSQKVISIRAGGRADMQVAVSQGLRPKAKSVKVNAIYAGQSGGGYPAFGC